MRHSPLDPALLWPRATTLRRLRAASPLAQPMCHAQSLWPICAQESRQDSTAGLRGLCRPAPFVTMPTFVVGKNPVGTACPARLESPHGAIHHTRLGIRNM